MSRLKDQQFDDDSSCQISNHHNRREKSKDDNTKINIKVQIFQKNEMEDADDLHI